MTKSIYGIIFALSAYFFTTSLRVVVKWLSVEIHIVELVFFRNAFALIPLTIFLFLRKKPVLVPLRNRKGMFKLSALGLLSMTSIFTSYHFMSPVAAESIIFTAPLFVVLFTSFSGKEKISFIRSILLLFGFLGTMIILQPWKAQFEIYFLIPLVAASLSALVSLSMVEINKTEDPLDIAIWFSIQMTLLNFPFLFFVWKMPSVLDFYLLLLIGILAGLAQYFLIIAYRYASATIITPFQYSSLIWAFIYGYLIWNDIPGQNVYFGCLIIIVSGILIARREMIQPE